MGRLNITPLLTSKEYSSRDGFLDFENKKYVVSYLCLGRTQLAHSIACSFHRGVLVHRRWTPTAHPGGCGVAIYLLSQFIIFISFLIISLDAVARSDRLLGKGMIILDSWDTWLDFYPEKLGQFTCPLVIYKSHFCFIFVVVGSFNVPKFHFVFGHTMWHGGGS